MNETMRAFNQLFFDFLNHMNEMISHEEIAKSIPKLELIKRTNPTILVKVWHHFVYIPYHDAIQKKDLTLFLEKDYTEDLRYLSHRYVQEATRMIDSIRKPVSAMDESQRALCVQYLDQLCKLSRIYDSGSV
jgi:hypothetical protein